MDALADFTESATFFASHRKTYLIDQSVATHMIIQMPKTSPASTLFRAIDARSAVPIPTTPDAGTPFALHFRMKIRGVGGAVLIRHFTLIALALGTWFGLSLTTACAPIPAASSDSHSLTRAPYSNGQRRITLTGMAATAFATEAAVLKNTNVVCDQFTREQCPSAVGMLVVPETFMKSETELDVEQCTTFLSEDNQTIVTNSHCIPERLKHAGADCRGQIHVVFPRTPDAPNEAVSCARMLSVTEIEPQSINGKRNPHSGERPDSAVFRLAHPVRRTPFVANRSGLPDRMPLRLFAMDPDETEQPAKKIKAVLRVRACEVVQGNFVLPDFLNDLAPVGVTAGCEVIRGNSGSAMIDNDNHVRAIAHGSFVSADIEDAAQKSGVELTQPLRSASLITNLACTSLNGRSDDVNPACGLGPQGPDDLLRVRWAKIDARFFGPIFQEWLTHAPNKIGYALGRLEHVIDSSGDAAPLYTPQIRCIHRNTISGGAERIDVQKPIWTTQSAIDGSTRVILRPRVLTQLHLTLSFHSAVLLREGRVTGELSGTADPAPDFSGLRFDREPVDLEICGN